MMFLFEGKFYPPHRAKEKEIICDCGETDPYKQADCPYRGCGLTVDNQKGGF